MQCDIDLILEPLVRRAEPASRASPVPHPGDGVAERPAVDASQRRLPAPGARNFDLADEVFVRQHAGTSNGEGFKTWERSAEALRLLEASAKPTAGIGDISRASVTQG